MFREYLIPLPALVLFLSVSVKAQAPECQPIDCCQTKTAVLSFRVEGRVRPRTDKLEVERPHDLFWNLRREDRLFAPRQPDQVETATAAAEQDASPQPVEIKYTTPFRLQARNDVPPPSARCTVKTAVKQVKTLNLTDALRVALPPDFFKPGDVKNSDRKPFISPLDLNSVVIEYALRGSSKQFGLTNRFEPRLFDSGVTNPLVAYFYPHTRKSPYFIDLFSDPADQDLLLYTQTDPGLSQNPLLHFAVPLVQRNGLSPFIQDYYSSFHGLNYAANFIDDSQTGITSQLDFQLRFERNYYNPVTPDSGAVKYHVGYRGGQSIVKFFTPQNFYGFSASNIYDNRLTRNNNVGTVLNFRLEGDLPINLSRHNSLKYFSSYKSLSVPTTASRELSSALAAIRFNQPVAATVRPERSRRVARAPQRHAAQIPVRSGANEPSSSVTATEGDPAVQALSGALKAAEKGEIVFQPAQEMTVGVKQRVVIAIAKEIKQSVAQQIGNGNRTTIEEIYIGAVMKAQLKGEHFEITQISEEKQVVQSSKGDPTVGDGTTKWMWDVMPTESGNHKLTLTVDVRTSVPGLTGEVALYQRVFDRDINVSVNRTYAMRKFLVTNWQYFLTGLCGVISSVVAFFCGQYWNSRAELKKLNLTAQSVVTEVAGSAGSVPAPVPVPVREHRPKPPRSRRKKL